MDRATYDQLDRIESKLNLCMDGVRMIMQRLDEVDETQGEEQPKTQAESKEDVEKEKKVNPDNEYRQKQAE